MEIENGAALPQKVIEDMTIELARLNDLYEDVSSRISHVDSSTNELTAEFQSQLRDLSRNIDILQKEVHNVSAQFSRDVKSMSFHNDRSKDVLVEQFEAVKERLEGNRQDLQGIRERDLAALAKESTVSVLKSDLESIKNTLSHLPTVENIRSQLLSENSGLATQAKLAKTDKEVHFLRGMLAANLFTTVMTFATMLFIGVNTLRGLSKDQTSASSHFADIFRNIQLR